MFPDDVRVTQQWYQSHALVSLVLIRSFCETEGPYTTVYKLYTGRVWWFVNPQYTIVSPLHTSSCSHTVVWGFDTRSCVTVLTPGLLHDLVSGSHARVCSHGRVGSFTRSCIGTVLQFCRF